MIYCNYPILENPINASKNLCEMNFEKVDDKGFLEVPCNYPILENPINASKNLCEMNFEKVGDKGFLEVSIMNRSENFMQDPQKNDYAGKTADFLKKKTQEISTENPIAQIGTKIKDTALLQKMKDYGVWQRFWGYTLLLTFIINIFQSTLWTSDFFLYLIGNVIGGLLLYKGLEKKKISRRLLNYYNIIGNSEQYSLPSLSQLTQVPISTIQNDLSKRLQLGIYPNGFLDSAHQVIVIKNVDSYAKNLQTHLNSPTLPTENPLSSTFTEESSILAELSSLRKEINDSDFSRKIYKVSTLTSNIFELRQDNPQRENDTQKMLNYYLPVTLKLIRSYQQLEKQTTQGEHISSSMQQIQATMDKIVEGFEKQIDLLFKEEAIDIATDIQILEQMMSQDGLSD